VVDLGDVEGAGDNEQGEDAEHEADVSYARRDEGFDRRR
jgi:hypothetical protein